MAVDSHGRPIDFEITGGEVNDSQVACQLIDLVQTADYLLGDKEYEAFDRYLSSGETKINRRTSVQTAPFNCQTLVRKFQCPDTPELNEHFTAIKHRKDRTMEYPAA